MTVDYPNQDFGFSTRAREVLVEALLDEGPLHGQILHIEALVERELDSGFTSAIPPLPMLRQMAVDMRYSDGSKNRKLTPMPFKTLIERPNPKELVRDPDLQFSLDQLVTLMNQAPDVRLPIVSSVVGTKLSARLNTESLNNLDSACQFEILTLTSEYLLQVLCLPLLGERAALKKHVEKFLKLALRMQPMLVNESYTVLINGLMPGRSFEVAATEVFNLTESLKATIAASENSIRVLGSTQRSTLEQSRLMFAIKLASALDCRHLEIHADFNSLYVRILRASIHTVHFAPDEDGTDVLGIARNAIAHRKGATKRSSDKKKKQR